MPIRKRMSPIASSARSKRSMRPKRRKKPPFFLKREKIRNEVGSVRREWEEALVGKRVDLGGGICGGFLWRRGTERVEGGAYLPPVQNATPISGGRGLVYYTCCSSKSIGRSRSRSRGGVWGMDRWMDGMV